MWNKTAFLNFRRKKNINHLHATNMTPNKLKMITFYVSKRIKRSISLTSYIVRRSISAGQFVKYNVLDLTPNWLAKSLPFITEYGPCYVTANTNHEREFKTLAKVVNNISVSDTEQFSQCHFQSSILSISRRKIGWRVSQMKNINPQSLTTFFKTRPSKLVSFP